MRTASICLFFLLPWIGFAQNPTDRTVYLDSTFNPAIQGNHQYYRVISEYYKKQLTYQMKTFYKSGQLYSVGYSKSNEFQNETGAFDYYYEKRQQKETHLL